MLNLLPFLSFSSFANLVSALQGTSKNLLRGHLLRLRASRCTSKTACRGAIAARSLRFFEVPYSLLPLLLQGAPALASAACIVGGLHATRNPFNALAGKPVNCVLGTVQLRNLG